MRSARSDATLMVAVALAATAALLSSLPRRPAALFDPRPLLAQVAVAINAMGWQDIGLTMRCDDSWTPADFRETLPGARAAERVCAPAGEPAQVAVAEPN
jgi:hypothetical protein